MIYDENVMAMFGGGKPLTDEEQRKEEIERRVSAPTWWATARARPWDVDLGVGDDRQATATRWARETFGDEVLRDRKERVLRVLEEAIELAQAEGVTAEEARRLVDYVLARPPGEPAQELGGVRLTCLVYASAAGFSADTAELAELERVLVKDPEVFRRRNREKRNAGVGRVP